MSRRRNIGASRRKRDDEGEDGDSGNDELDDDSLSDSSDITYQDDDDADADGSEASDGDTSIPQQESKVQGSRVNGRGNQKTQRVKRYKPVSSAKLLVTSASSDTEVMLKEVGVSNVTSATEARLDELEGEPDTQARTPSAPPTESRGDTLAERKRREHGRHAKERNANPANVPMRGSFFLHDKRSSDAGANGYRPPSKPKSRPYGLIVDGNVRKQPSRLDASEGQWTHDLHDTITRDNFPSFRGPVMSTSAVIPSNPVPTAPKSSPPNRSFSNTTLIGNVSVVVFLPGMAGPISYSAVPKKQHTRLPQHRPPLRRDKPVRISLPGQSPRYIFPSTERSFIFIPRALRPNQQGFRGRGRGGIYGARRGSFYSPYAPGVSVSRRPSHGRAASQEGYNSPGGSVFPRASVAVTDNEKPVVRLPPLQPPTGTLPLTGSHGSAQLGVLAPVLLQPQNLPYRESRPAPIPMHQPRPKKAVSVADIESPASISFNPSQPQQEQTPNHQSVRYVHETAASSAHPTATTLAPLPHIPERAIHAQPFQPYGFPPAPGYYSHAYPPGVVCYPASGPEYPPYGGHTAAPVFPPGQQASYTMPTPLTAAEQTPQLGTVAHEAGGMVYYYDANQVYPTMPPPGTGPDTMMAPLGATYFFHLPQYYGS